jgi:NAD(P)-dependent dehydrogenase (short-subunit alcohol dehydrogenase family)
LTSRERQNGTKPMSNSLAGRTAVVTGAARGIGDAIAERLLADGANVFSLDKVATSEPRAGVVYLEADVTDPFSVAQAFKAVDAKTDAIDILVNNAGIQRVGLVGNISFAEWSAVVATHLNGFFLCASEAVPRMVARGKGGAIVSIASTAAFVGLPGRSAYCAAKAGILGLTRALALEVASAGIRVNAVAPGFTRTKLIEQGLADGSLPRGLDGRADPDEAPRHYPGDRQRRALSRRRRSILRDRPDDHRRRWLDRAGHTARANLVADPRS